MSKKVLIFYKQLNDQFCEAIERQGMEPISFFREGGEGRDFKVSFRLKYENILRRVFLGDKNFLHRKYKEYHEKRNIERMKLIAKKHPSIDYALFFRADCYPSKVIDICREISQKMITYQFDSMSISQNLLSNISKFDKIFTFDKKDLLEYGFQPLTNCWFPSFTQEPTNESDIFYVGVGTPDRIEKIKKINEYAVEKHLKIKAILTIPPHIKAEKMGGGGRTLAYRGIF